MYKSEELENVLSHHRTKANSSDSKASHVHQHQENLSAILSTDSDTSNSSKPNQVGTVLLYGVPIVSLHIESQERLCLAQISNTLLKQFSYNEIHNRRVALGITCVQCTPVQLEILRRAGAMPVSSRRCGMITRREAERLCKSFLGDNSPPRLPDDFSFSVFHECAWGCRGQFLPSRYNSSRAKCIKCSYCGLFFSPNKFIFHSHRIGPGDKYVQPDAANFNSWRRHMKLSGVSPDEIMHAWEDVKAMFNGGTRKRLMSSVSTASTPSSNTSTATAMSNGSVLSNSNVSLQQSPKRLKESNTSQNQTDTLSPPIMQAAVAAAVAVAANAGHQYPIRPVNVHSSKMNANSSRLLNTSSMGSNSVARNPNSLAPDIAPSIQLSRSFVMDYMWHTQQQQHHSAYALPWLKQPSTHIFFNHQSFHHNHQPNSLNSSASPQSDAADNDKSGGSCRRRGSNDRIVSPTAKPYSPTSSAMQYYKNSAFKPVLGAHRAQLFNESVLHSPILASSSASPVQNNRIDQTITSNYSNNNEFGKCRTKRFSHRRIESNNEQLPSENRTESMVQEMEPQADNVSSDDEMVDIETTEENSLAAHSVHRSMSNHSNNSLINDRQSISSSKQIVENGASSIHTATVNSGTEILKAMNSEHHPCGNNNNIFLSNNNNNDFHKSHNSNCNVENKIQSSAVDLGKSANSDNGVSNVVLPPLIDDMRLSSKVSAIASAVCDNDEAADDRESDDDRSTNSNCSNIDVVDMESHEKVEQKPIVSNFDVLSTSTNSDTNNWINCNSPEKISDTSYQNCEGDSVPAPHQHSDIDGLNLMTNSLKKEHHLKTGFSFNNSTEDVRETNNKSDAVLDLSKIDNETTDLKFNPSTAIPYEKGEMKWHSTPLSQLNSSPAICSAEFRNSGTNTARVPNGFDGKFRKSPSLHQQQSHTISTSSPSITFSTAAASAASAANILLNNHRIGQFYPRPGQLAFHHHYQHHFHP